MKVFLILLWVFASINISMASYKKVTVGWISEKTNDVKVKSKKIDKFGKYIDDIFGVGALKAQSAAELTWAKNKKRSKLAKDDEEEKSTRVVALSEDMTVEELHAQLNPIIAMALSSGKVKNEKKMRANLFKRAEEMHGLMNDIFHNQSSSWEVSRFRLNLSFGVSGNIFKIARPGGDFRIRLDWNKVARTSALDLDKRLKIKS